MSARAQSNGLHPKSWVVVVTVDKSSTSVGPYHSQAKAEVDARAWDGSEGRTAWVDPVYTPQQFAENAAQRRI